MIAKDHLSDRVFFFERSSPINLTVYAYKLNNYEYESTFFEKKKMKIIESFPTTNFVFFH